MNAGDSEPVFLQCASDFWSFALSDIYREGMCKSQNLLPLQDNPTQYRLYAVCVAKVGVIRRKLQKYLQFYMNQIWIRMSAMNLIFPSHGPMSSNTFFPSLRKFLMRKSQCRLDNMADIYQKQIFAYDWGENP